MGFGAMALYMRQIVLTERIFAPQHITSSGGRQDMKLISMFSARKMHLRSNYPGDHV